MGIVARSRNPYGLMVNSFFGGKKWAGGSLKLLRASDLQIWKIEKWQNHC
jgi:hypothetical protein